MSGAPVVGPSKIDEGVLVECIDARKYANALLLTLTSGGDGGGHDVGDLLDSHALKLAELDPHFSAIERPWLADHGEMWARASCTRS